MSLLVSAALVMSWVLLIVTGAQNWKKTKDDHLRSLATSIGTAHGFPKEVADALGCYMIGEVIGCVHYPNLSQRPA